MSETDIAGSRSRLGIIVFAMLAAVLVVTAQPAAAANATASEHDTFGTGSQGEPDPVTLQNVSVAGSGASASADFQGAGKRSYNPVTDDGDGVTDTQVNFIGDSTFDDVGRAEVRIRPTFSGDIDELTFNVDQVQGSDYGASVDVFIVQEQPDQVYGEGTKVATFDPDYQSGTQTVQFDSAFSVSSSTNYAIEFVTSGTDNDGVPDRLRIKVDDSATATWYTADFGGGISSDAYPDVSVSASAIDSGRYVGATHQASDIVQGEVDLALSNTDATVRWQEDDDNDQNWNTVTKTTHSTSGLKTADLSGTDANRWRVRVDFSKTGSAPQGDIELERVIYDNDAPAGSNPSPTGNPATYGGDIELDVSDPDFPTAHGDEVAVSVQDSTGDLIGSENVTQNTTVAVAYNPSSGANNLTWTLTDQASATATVDQNFSAPDKIEIRTESRPHNLITGADVVVKYIEDGDSNQTVIRRTDSDADGRISVGGLDSDTRVFISATADGYQNRTITLESILNQNVIYLINDSARSVDNRLTVTDQTGQFDPADTVITVEKQINKSLYASGGFQYQAVAGDRLGSDNGFPAALVEDDRYRVVVVNSDGDRRVLGAYTPSTPGVVVFEIGTVVAVQEQSQDVAWDAARNDTGSGLFVTFEYNDTQDNTDTLYVEIYEDGNNSNVLLPNTSFRNLGTLTVSEPVPAAENDTSWAVEFTAVRDGADNIQSKRIVGPQRQVLPGLAGWIVATISIGLIWVVAGLFSQLNGAVGGLVVAGMGGMFWFTGFVPAELGSGVVALSMITAGLLFVNSRRDGGL